MRISFLHQAAMRVFALSLPLVVVVAVRHYGAPEIVPIFFTLLTDTALLVAFCKLGVDVYLPSCRLEGKVVVVRLAYKVLYISVGILLLLYAGLSYATEGYWQLFLAATCVLSCLGLAEVGRLRGNFLLFYLLKSPVLYVGALVVVLLTGHVVALCILVFVTVGIWYVLSTNLQSENSEISGNALFASAIVSLAILLFSWKEAAISRIVLSGQSLDSLVMYSRLVMIVTFPFMLQNARVPLLLRDLGSRTTANALRGTLSKRRLMICLWALLSSGLVVIYAYHAETELALGVVYLMLGACLLVVFGNIGAALVFYRKYWMILASYVAGAVAFLVSLGCTIIMEFSISVFTMVSFASLVGQIGFSCVLVYSFSLFCRQGDFELVAVSNSQESGSSQDKAKTRS